MTVGPGGKVTLTKAEVKSIACKLHVDKSVAAAFVDFCDSNKVAISWAVGKYKDSCHPSRAAVLDGLLGKINKISKELKYE